jgi:orotate phosphoribosyltransferase
LEGNFREGDTVILIEDVVTSGQSVIDTATKLEEHGLIVKQIITVFSRSNNKNLTYKNIPIEYLFHIDDIDME